MENSTLITIESLKKHFLTSAGRFTALNGIDLKIGKQSLQELWVQVAAVKQLF